MERKSFFPGSAPQDAMPTWKRAYYYIVIAGLSIFGILIFLFFMDVLLIQEWFLATLLGGVFLFLCWVIVQLLRLPRTSGATTFNQLDTSTGYIIHAHNEWTGETEAISFHWEQIDALLIGIWTNPGFKGRKYDYVGARLVYRYDQNGVKKYADHIIVCEKKLEKWVDTITRHAIPALVTNSNISAVEEQDFDTMLIEIHAVTIGEITSVKDWFMEQDDFTLWHPSAIHQ
ncbi:hypothetical protein [Sporosarcina sp. Te-1]|uniref:hypothetical protein n=1 Tax=Sporosarcina sp. Te-1 TaxID=2818390 RepID=UPI001A9EDADD|nr:hypothetical protein [Sporosarcina sp. Te-1]QTD39876.1 hypothetical protein J3U78_13670 [Sporosarcina sp. Te-1]